MQSTSKFSYQDSASEPVVFERSIRSGKEEDDGDHKVVIISDHKSKITKVVEFHPER